MSWIMWYVCSSSNYSYCIYFFFFFKQKTAYEMRISDWSSDVCSSDLHAQRRRDGKGLSAFAALRGGTDGAAAGGDRDGRARRGADAQIGRASCRERVCQYV